MQDEPKSYELPKQSLPGLGAAEHIADLNEFRAFLEGRGIQTKNTRIERYIEYLTKLEYAEPKKESVIFKNSIDERFKSSGDWFLYVLREVHELMWILRGLKQHIPLGIDDKLKIIVSGSDFAALDANPHCRNVQFELRIASYFCQSGCEVDLTTNTDIIASKGENAFFVECKRIASTSQLQRRLGEAAQQLKRRMPRNLGNRTAYGCIAADVTKAAYSHNGLTFGITNVHSRDVIQKKLISISKIITRAPLFDGRCNILKYWLQIHIPCLITHPPTTITRFSSYFIQNPRIEKNGWSAFANLCDIAGIGGSQPDERTIPPKPLTLRKGLSLPKGTTFMPVDNKLLLSVIEGGKPPGSKDEDIICELTINEIKHQFCLYDLESLIASTPKDEMKRLSNDDIQTRLELLLKLFMRRYPYKEIGDQTIDLPDGDIPDETGPEVRRDDQAC